MHRSRRVRAYILEVMMRLWDFIDTLRAEPSIPDHFITPDGEVMFI